MAILPDRDELSTPADGDLYMTTDVSDVTDAATGTDKKITWANIKAALLTYFNTVYQPLNAVLTNTTASFLTAMETKINFITVTQAVNLDQMETDIAALANGMVYKGDWDASAGTFPGGGTAQIGHLYYVSVAGTVDSVEFAVGDNIVATVDNASTGTYASNWSKHDQTDAVQSVAGLVGSISASALKTALSLVKADVGLGNVDNTSNATERAATTTLSNKRITSRIGTVASSATPTPTGDDSDQYNITALAVNATLAAPTGTPANGQKLILRIKDNGTTRTLAYNAIYRAVGVTLPTATTASKTIVLGCIYNSADSKWDVVAVAEEA